MTDRKLLVLPVTQGVVSFSTAEVISVDGCEGRLDIHRDRIEGRQPEKGEQVIVLDIQDLVDALHAGDDDLAEYPLNGTVTKKTAKAVFLRLSDNRIVSLPSQYVTADVEEFVSEVRLPRWLALDRGL